MLSCLSIFCLECASFVLRAANMYVCLSLSRWVLTSSEPKYLNFDCKKADTGDTGMGHIQSIKSWGIPQSAHWGTG